MVQKSSFQRKWGQMLEQVCRNIPTCLWVVLMRCNQYKKTRNIVIDYGEALNLSYFCSNSDIVFVNIFLQLMHLQ